MNEDQAKKLLDSMNEAKSLLAEGGFDLGDLPHLIRLSAEAAESFKDLDRIEKRAIAETFAGDLIDELLVEATPKVIELIQSIDIPFLPEAIERVTFDPFAIKWSPLLIRAAVKLLLPGFFDLIVSASKGEVAINR